MNNILNSRTTKETSDSKLSAWLPPSVKGRRVAFTLVELLIVIAIIAILAAMLMPVLNAAKVRAQGIQCLSNLRQVMTGVLLYPNDNGDLLPINRSGGGNGTNGNWVGGIMTYGSDQNTNTPLLLDPKDTQISPYVQNPAAHKCPADLSTHNVKQQGAPRIRSYSMSGAVGCQDYTGAARNAPFLQTYLPASPPAPAGSTWMTYSTLSQMKGGLGPADLFVLIDEHPDFQVKGEFALILSTLPSQLKWGLKAGTQGGDVPTKYHGNRCPIAFADGHVEMHKWLYPNLIPPVLYQPGGVYTTPDLDIVWFYYHSSIPVH